MLAWRVAKAKREIDRGAHSPVAVAVLGPAPTEIAKLSDAKYGNYHCASQTPLPKGLNADALIQSIAFPAIKLPPALLFRKELSLIPTSNAHTMAMDEILALVFGGLRPLLRCMQNT